MLVTSFRRRHRDFETFFSSSKDVVYCNDADGLFGALDHVHNQEEWRLFTDSSKASLKALLFHNDKIHPFIPLAYSVHTKESHERIRALLSQTDCENYKW